ncbi:Lactadherin [Exaiptasia diaphana]|nr:Lactadherin [Exaiptasia diaphana]
MFWWEKLRKRLGKRLFTEASPNDNAELMVESVISRVSMHLFVFYIIEYHSLGMEDGRISDSQITASSHNSRYVLPKNARLNNVRAWKAKQEAVGEYLEVDIGTNTNICKIASQGSRGTQKWVTSYSIHYSSDQSTWTTYSANENGVEKSNCSYSTRSKPLLALINCTQLFLSVEGTRSSLKL